VLSAPHVLEYDYRRSLGPVLGAFFTGLRDRRLLGSRTGAGRVLVPPAEADPETGEPVSDELVEVGPGATVVSWCWVPEPRPTHPLDHPFAFALVRPDGADTALLHVVDAGSPERMATGLRVQARWADEPRGGIRDLACFEPEESR